MIPASVELWLTAVCPFGAKGIGANARGSINANNNPVARLEVLV